MVKEFRLSSFDSSLADSLGFSSQILHYLLMSLVAVTTVAAFEAVGSIIVIAMLIVPAAIALLLTRRLVPMLCIASLVGVAAAFFGHLAAITTAGWFGYDSTSTSGMITTVAGLLFAIAWLFSPSEGLVNRYLKRRGGIAVPENEAG